MNKKNEKPTAIFLPDKLCDRRLWEKQMNDLSDLISPRFIDLTPYSTLTEMIGAVLKEAPPQFILIGFSMGGYVAIELMMGLERQRVEKLVLVGASGKGHSEETRNHNRRVAESLRKFEFKGLSVKAIQQLIHPSQYQNFQITQLIQDMAIQAGREVYYRQQMATLHREDRRSQLNRVDCPTLIIGGSHDPLLSPEDAQDLAHRFPKGDVKILECSGHMIPLEKPDELSLTLRNWLISQEPS